MPAPATSLPLRSQQLVSTMLVLMAVMGLAPLAEIASLRWQLGFGDLAWRYDTVVMLLSNGPQLVILYGLIGIIGAVTGNRFAMRIVACVLGLVVVATVVLVPLLLLDHLQMLPLMPRSKLGAFKLAGMKSIGFGTLVGIAAGIGAFHAWRASASDSTRIRHKKGEGLVVGQAGEPEMGK